jgi:endo-beta-N-acetylglucosaminidase D
MNKHDMFKINLDGDKVQYEGFDCWNNSCGMFTEREALACAIIMVHTNLGMMTLSLTDGKVIRNFRYSETKIAQLLE